MAKIKIDIFSSSAEVIIKLADNGGGIKAKNLKKILQYNNNLILLQIMIKKQMKR